MNNAGNNRLNFANIVQKHLDNQNHGPKYFKPSQVHMTYNNNTAKAHNNKITKENNDAMIQVKVDSLIALVHSKLNDKKTRGLNEKSKNLKSTSTKPVSLIIDNNCSCRAKDIVNNTGDHKRLNIPRIKVLCSHKKKERLHHTIPLNHDHHYVCHKRLEDAKQKHRAISCMLEDQKQLNIDRRLMAQEIRTMRGHLNDIRGRLDSSIKKLGKNKTYSECQMHQNEGKTDEKGSRQQIDLKSAKEQEKCCEENFEI